MPLPTTSSASTAEPTHRLRRYGNAIVFIVCLHCTAQLAIAMRLNGLEERVAVMTGICGRCSGAFGAAVVCSSHHCPLYFERVRITERLEADQALRDIVLEW